MSLAARTLNRWLEGEPWARERLAAHAGRSFAIDVGPTDSRFAIASDGTLADEPSAPTPPDLRLRLSPLAVPAFLADPARWDEFVTAEGDAALAGTLRELAPTLPWLVEADFARVLGPIAGKRVADAGRSALGVPGHVAERLIANAGSWARDEAQLLAHPAGLRELAADVDALSGRAAAIETRIARLEGKPDRSDERE
jgi:ubiquinone biosynthesis protein UbiJ